MIQTMSTILNNHLGAIFSHPMVNNWAKKFRPPPPTCSIIPPSRRSVSSCRLWTSNCKTGYWDYGAKAKEARFESVGVHYANRGGCQSRRIGAYPSRWVRYGVVWSPIEKTAGISTKIGIVAQWHHQLWIPTSIWEETEYPPNAQQSLIPIAGEYACRWARIYCAGTLLCVTKQAHRCIHNLEPVHLKAKYVTFLPERSQALWPTKLRDYPSSTWYGTIDIVTRCDIACDIAFVASIPCDIAFVSSITCMCACDKNLERYDCLTVWKQSRNFSRTKIRPDVSLLYVILHTDFLLCCFFFRFCKKNDMRGVSLFTEISAEKRSPTTF